MQPFFFNSFFKLIDSVPKYPITNICLLGMARSTSILFRTLFFKFVRPDFPYRKNRFSTSVTASALKVPSVRDSKSEGTHSSSSCLEREHFTFLRKMAALLSPVRCAFSLHKEGVDSGPEGVESGTPLAYTRKGWIQGWRGWSQVRL